MQSFSQEVFFQNASGRMFYVGFLKSPNAWFPLCFVSDPEVAHKFDTLLVSPSFQLMDETLKDYAKRVSAVEDTFVQYLTMEEIKNLVGDYALNNVMIVETDPDHGSICGCGCGCG